MKLSSRAVRPARARRNGGRDARNRRSPPRNPPDRNRANAPERTQLGIGGLPEQEIRQALLAGGADDEVRIRNAGRVQPRRRSPRRRCLPGRSRPAATSSASARAAADDLLTRAVIEGDDQRQSGVGRGQSLPPRAAERRCRRKDRRASPITLTRTLLACSSARSLRMKRCSSASRLCDLLGRARPVLDREGIDREIVDAELDRGAHRPAQRLDAAPVALEARQAARRRPAAVAVHDQRDMTRRRPRRQRRRAEFENSAVSHRFDPHHGCRGKKSHSRREALVRIRRVDGSGRADA